ncbi:molybdenum cofactor synthesis domain protein [Caldisphaera lagunensis DSM 15908]|uniref:Molybdenum cofactor synthesis domain protein n=1 Tax=Caldisphaera lagunensis (strain DSM 15908 / JCM 11604 / ANMR 0165 / IC-154) TaxID=1056495 RepID=L0ABS6_CALLD|nr:molybdopterin biosynthesis protein [Caldisphaera lagunensis]AFZ70879.1 molybdenum cofactor synthesis domain protein [Caldisphaera lagunensis DSM 15908]
MALVFHKLVSVEEAIKLIEKETNGIGPLGVIEVPILESINKVLAEDVVAPIDYPPFDRSTVDGYAVRSIDIAGASEIEPKELEVIGKVEVGSHPSIEVKPGTAVQISTGAMVPRGADSIVMEEYVSRKDNKIKIYRMSSPGENISMSGSDIATGDVVIRKNTQITARELAVFAGLGLNKIKVYRPPKIIVYSTGVELEQPGNILPHGKIYDSNGYVITAMLRELGADVEFRGILPDNYDKMKDEISKSINEADILITTGSTSAGYGDMIYKVFNDVGAKIIVHGLKSRPGKPTAIAVLGKKILFGLPGFPLSAMMNLYNIVEPIVRKMMGKGESEKPKVKARIPFRLNAGRGFTELIPVQLVWNKDYLSAYPILSGSGSIAGISISDGYIVAQENREYFEENEEVDVYLFSSSIRPPDLTIIGSNCPGIEVVLNGAKIQNSRIINVGSLGGWNAIKRGDADLAGSHLLDEKTMNYNIHMPKLMGLEDKVYIYRGYSREVGILVKKNNPKNIKDVSDFLRDDIVIINRNKGSGTRVLLDKMLKENGINEPEKLIKGYTYEVKTHSAVATAILQGRADAGISLRAMAELFNLDFIPIGVEIYDFIVRKEKIENKFVNKFLETLKSEEFSKELEKKLPGYKTLKESGERIYP